MKVYVARHAETNYNVLGLCNDDPKVNVYLTTKGINQAKLLAEALKPIEFDLIITSEFPRAKETADIVNKFHKSPTIIDPRINDVRTGFEGRPVREFREARIKADDHKWGVHLNGGESFADEKLRTESFLSDLKKRPEKCVLVVTHQAIARFIYAIIHNIPNEEVSTIKVSNTHCFNFKL